MNFEFSKAKAIIFDFDGTLYNSSNLALNLILRSLDHPLFLKNERKARKFFQGKDFQTKENFYKTFFEYCAKICHTSESIYSTWFFTKYLPLTVKVLNQKYKMRNNTNHLFELLQNKKIPFAIYSDYSFVEEKAKSIGLTNLEKIQKYSAEEFGCLKPASRGFLEIAKTLKVLPKDCLVIGDREDTDGKGALNSGMQFIQIETKKNLKHPPKESTIRMSWETFSNSLISYLNNN